MAEHDAFYLLADEPIEINAGRRAVQVDVWNTGDRAIQVGSHFHFFEVNRALRFDRAAAFGMRLDIPAGTAGRVEPGRHERLDERVAGRDGRAAVTAAAAQRQP